MNREEFEKGVSLLIDGAERNKSFKGLKEEILKLYDIEMEIPQSCRWFFGTGFGKLDSHGDIIMPEAVNKPKFPEGSVTKQVTSHVGTDGKEVLVDYNPNSVDWMPKFIRGSYVRSEKIITPQDLLNFINNNDMAASELEAKLYDHFELYKYH